MYDFFVWTIALAIGLAVIPIVMWVIKLCFKEHQRSEEIRKQLELVEKARDYVEGKSRLEEVRKECERMRKARSVDPNAFVYVSEPKILPIPDEWKPEPQRTARTPYMWMDE